MRDIEAMAFETGDVSGLELMELAGRQVYEQTLVEFPHLARSPGGALVLCGPGNNGGDGYVIARYLMQSGWQVQCFAMATPENLPPDARTMAERFLGLPGAEMRAVQDAPCETRLVQAFDLVIDAVFGSGLTRAFERHAALQLSLAAAWRDRRASGIGPRFVAVDIPSGLCADSGRVLGSSPGDSLRDTLHADLTVTFETPFLGHRLAQGPELCGKVVVAPLGRCVARVRAEQDRNGMVWPIETPRAADIHKSGAAHKFGYGHALVLAGGAGHGGAAQLAARAALRVGAGLVTLGPPETAMAEHAAGPVAALMQRAVDSAADLKALLQDTRFSALVVGPGLGLDGRGAELVAAALEADRPVVMDADALTLLARDTALRKLIHAKVIITPHEGELARLCPDVMRRFWEPARDGPAFSAVDVARETARDLGCRVVFKGRATVLAAPSGGAWVHGGEPARAAPDLATAGSGDVLVGMIGGLLARRLPPRVAAASAIWLHAEAARSIGPGLIADDLPEALPGVLRALPL